MRDMSKRERSTFNAEFKLQVVQMNRVQGLSVGDVKRNITIGAALRQPWCVNRQRPWERIDVSFPQVRYE